MALTLEGGCRVSQMREGDPFEFGNLRQWTQVDQGHGAKAISLRVSEISPGLAAGILNPDCDEVFYRLGDEANDANVSVYIDGWRYERPTDSGIYLRPNQNLTIENQLSDPVVVISSRCPEPIDSRTHVPPLRSPRTGFSEPDPIPIVRLTDQRAQPTADRWYRVLIDDRVGSPQVTQFVGSIPPGRAPDHFHEYEEVLFILKGEGRMWAGESNTPISVGSCIYLPKGQVHCVENTGKGELRLLGVFYPAGSPSVRYDA